jgi:hypothetical protein
MNKMKEKSIELQKKKMEFMKRVNVKALGGLGKTQIGES